MCLFASFQHLKSQLEIESDFRKRLQRNPTNAPVDISAFETVISLISRSFAELLANALDDKRDPAIEEHITNLQRVQQVCFCFCLFFSV